MYTFLVPEQVLELIPQRSFEQITGFLLYLLPQLTFGKGLQIRSHLRVRQRACDAQGHLERLRRRQAASGAALRWCLVKPGYEFVVDPLRCQIESTATVDFEEVCLYPQIVIPQHAFVERRSGL